MFSKSCEYAIRALTFISLKAREDAGTVLKINEIASAIDAPAYYTSKILQQLSRLEIISSLKGPNGGFYFEPEQLNTRLIDIVVAIDGKKIFEGCALGLHHCSEEKPCALHDEFIQIRNDLTTMMEKTTIRTLSENIIEGKVLTRK